MLPKNRLAGPVRVSLVLLLAALFNSCAPGTHLRTDYATPPEVKGTFTVLLYGARYANDLETVAILDRQGDPYTFVMSASDYDYKVVKEMTAQEALSRATEFVSFHYAFRNTRLSTILDIAGNAIGYEVRPLYSPLEFGYSDVLDVQYRISDGTVTVWVSLIPQMKRKMFDEDRPLLFRHRW